MRPGRAAGLRLGVGEEPCPSLGLRAAL